MVGKTSKKQINKVVSHENERKEIDSDCICGQRWLLNQILKDDSHVKISIKNFSQRYDKCKGPEVELCLTCSRERKRPLWLKRVE